MRSRDSYVPIFETQPQILQTFTFFGANTVKPFKHLEEKIKIYNHSYHVKNKASSLLHFLLWQLHSLVNILVICVECRSEGRCNPHPAVQQAKVCQTLKELSSYIENDSSWYDKTKSKEHKAFPTNYCFVFHSKIILNTFQVYQIMQNYLYMINSLRSQLNDFSFHEK